MVDSEDDIKEHVWDNHTGMCNYSCSYTCSVNMLLRCYCLISIAGHGMEDSQSQDKAIECCNNCKSPFGRILKRKVNTF